MKEKKEEEEVGGVCRGNENVLKRQKRGTESCMRFETCISHLRLVVDDVLGGRHKRERE